jgi:hypothetical protein
MTGVCVGGVATSDAGECLPDWNLAIPHELLAIVWSGYGFSWYMLPSFINGCFCFVTENLRPRGGTGRTLCAMSGPKIESPRNIIDQ